MTNITHDVIMYHMGWIAVPWPMTQLSLGPCQILPLHPLQISFGYFPVCNNVLRVGSRRSGKQPVPTKVSPSDNHGLYITHTFQVFLLLTTYHMEPLLAGCAPQLKLPMRIIDFSKITVLLATIFNILEFHSQSCSNLKSIKRVGYL